MLHKRSSKSIASNRSICLLQKFSIDLPFVRRLSFSLDLCICLHSNKFDAFFRFDIQWLASFFSEHKHTKTYSIHLCGHQTWKRHTHFSFSFIFHRFSTTYKSEDIHSRLTIIQFCVYVFLFSFLFFWLNKCKMLNIRQAHKVYIMQYTATIHIPPSHSPTHTHTDDYLMHCFNQIVFPIATAALKQSDDIGMKISIFWNVLQTYMCLVYIYYILFMSLVCAHNNNVCARARSRSTNPENAGHSVEQRQDIGKCHICENLFRKQHLLCESLTTTTTWLMRFHVMLC